VLEVDVHPLLQAEPEGLVIHETLAVWEPKDDASSNGIMVISPRIQVAAARGMEINLRGDELLLMDYWAQAGQTELVGVSIHVEN
jgi:hypothetical protein